MKASEVYGLFSNDPRVAVIVGSGPSLADFDFEKLQDDRLWVIGINREPFLRDRSYFDAWIYSDAWLSFEYSSYPTGDMAIFETDAVKLKPLNVARPWRDKSYIFDQGYEDVGYVNCKGEPNWEYGSDSLFTKGTTATTAVNLALKLGFRKVLLLGIDLKVGPGREKYYSDRPSGKYGHNFKRMSDGMRFLAEKLRVAVPSAEIVNCSQITDVRCWPIMDFDQALENFTTR
jgi:hypothetical protein